MKRMATSKQNEQEETDRNHHVLASATVSASYNMLFQLSFRLLTFILNAFILRYITKDLLGVVNVRLTLLFVTILFIAREAFRKACVSKSKEASWTQIINLVWLTLPLGIICASIFALIWMYLLEQPDPDIVPYYHLGVVTFAASSVIEILAEPIRIVSQIMLYSRLRFLAEGLAQAVKCVISILLVAVFPQWGLIAFCIAQIIFVCCLAGLHYGYFIKEMKSHKNDENFPFRSLKDFFPKRISGNAWIDWKLAKLTWSFMKQSFLKQILTDGERYVMTIFGVLSFADQGIYDVINNLGSLAARFIFLPIEDGAYLLFSQTLERGKPAKEQTKDAIELASGVFECLLKGVLLTSLILLVFGYAYSFLLLDLYGGLLLSSESGPTLLRSYCVYVLLLAVNGVSEGFVFATMSKHEVDRYNHKMLLFSFVFLASAYYFTMYLGSVGFILANALNMVARIIHSVYYIMRFYQHSAYVPLKGLIPSSAVITTLAFSFLVTVTSEKTFCCNYGILWQGAHVLVGASCLLLTIIVICFAEQNLVAFVKEQYRKSRKSKTS